jgi:hypothetical protein
MKQNADITCVAAEARKTLGKTRISAHLARVVAARAAVDPRTVGAYVAGRKIASTCRARIEQALRELRAEGLLPADLTP